MGPKKRKQVHERTEDTPERISPGRIEEAG
jgi:hypothetical protein